MGHLRLILVGALATVACAQPHSGDEPSAEARQTVVEEINRTLDDYRDAVMRKDREAILSFWSESEDFVFAGDGRILGGFKAWSEQATRDINETERWLEWEWQNINVEVFSRRAASCTLEFEYSRITVGGDTLSSRGAWTYVFKKYGGSWKVIQTNGTHITL